MVRIVLDSITLARLRGCQESLEICDDSGRVMGFVFPASAALKNGAAEPQISEEEMQRRERAGGGRPLAAILADFEKRK